jgi:hypothetical protein
MKRIFPLLIVISAIVFLSGCAASYKPINPPTVNYTAHDLQDGIGFSYKYDVLREKQNNKYAKKETAKGVKVVAIKVTNHTDKTIVINRDLDFYLGNNQTTPMEPLVVKTSLKQGVAGHLGYLLLTFLKLWVNKNGEVTVYPIGYVLGPGLAIGNMAVAGTANNMFYTELNENNILFREIPAGQTVYGLIGIHDSGYNPLSVKLKK